MEDTNNKKKPGRPKKTIIQAPTESLGILENPVNEEDVIELVYCNPLLLKKIFTLQKAYGVSDIIMLFDKTRLQIITTDHLKKSTLFATIEGRYMNVYYCKEPIEICVKRDNLEKVIGSLGKNHSKMTFILKENYRSSLYCILKDMEYNTDDTYEIAVSFRHDRTPIAMPDDSNYPIKFHLTTRHFKTKVNNIKKISQTFTIQKIEGNPLQFTYDKDQRVNLISVYNDEQKIGLQCTLPPDDIFSVSVPVDYIKPISNSMLTDIIHIAAHKHERISFTTLMDPQPDGGWTIILKVFTEIKNVV